MSAPFYVTTPIYYPNAAPHLGTAYTTTYADTLVRYHRLAGEDAFFITGTDEHGEKLAEAAAAQGLAPQAFVDGMAERFREQWGALGLEPRRFVRTTDPAHVRAVQHFWQTMYDKGEIELRDYEGQYCVGCEEFKTERDLVLGKCPNHPSRAIESRRERNYFFRTSHYFDWLVAERKADPKRIALVGFSRGAEVGIVVGAAERRLAAVVSLYGGHFDALETGHLPAACPANYIGRISPRPLLMVNGTQDTDFDRATTVLPLQKLARKPNQFIWVETGHTVPPADTMADIIRWLAEKVK